ncbi:type VI secretion system baseplate subunit TssG [Acidisarcina polymorpha]
MQAEPRSFRFFQMVRLLERMHPERKPMGIFVTPADEVVRFTAPPALAFPASELGWYKPQEDKPASLEVNFLGLNVINGPMPRSYTETLLERQRGKDRATLEFFDLFNHRIVSLFYRAWTRYRFFIAYEKAQGGEDEITQRLYDLVGLGTPGLRGRMTMPEESSIYYSGLLSNQIRSVDGLKQILEDYFGVRVEIRQFTGSWVPLPEEQQTVLRDGESMAECLGIATVVGNEVWDQEGTMTVRLGPMPLARYREFLPGSRGQAELQDWLKFYSRRAFQFVVQLILERDEVPQIPLKAGPVTSSRLGYESWLKIKPMGRDPDETTYLIV